MTIFRIYVNKLTIPIIAFTFLLVNGCKNIELTRPEAEKQIRQQRSFPISEFKEFQSSANAAVVAYLIYNTDSRKEIIEGGTFPKPQLFLDLENSGMININVERIDDDKHLYYSDAKRYDYIEYYNAIFTEKAKPFVQGNSVKVSSIEFGEITGIVEKKEMKTAQVFYTEKRTSITPFGIAYNVNEEIFNRTANFTLYDDGWRIN